MLYIRNTAVVIKGGIAYVENTKSEASNRAIPISENGKSYFLKLLREQKQYEIDFGGQHINSGYVCQRPNGKPINPTWLTHKFKTELEKTKLPKIRFHDIRHSAATFLHESGWDLQHIQHYLGHAELSTTANIYGQL